MKVTVIATAEDADQARELLFHLKTLDLLAQNFVVKENWRDSKQRLDDLAAASSHLVVVYTVASADSAWLGFLAGYCLGAEKPLVLFSPQRSRLVPIYLASFFRFSVMEELTHYLDTEKKEWLSIIQRREARKTLLDFGISFREEAFAECVVEGNIQAAKLFIQAGLSVNSRDKRGTPLLCLAARKGQPSMAQLLLDAGAHIDLQSEDRGNSGLMDAVAAGNEDLVRWFLAAGASTEILSKNGQTALILAVGQKLASLVALLLEYGANPSQVDNIGLNAKQYAVLFQNEAIIKLLASAIVSKPLN